MGRVTVDFEVSNYADQTLVEAGHLTADKIRKVIVQGIVDTGAARLVLPESVVMPSFNSWVGPASSMRSSNPIDPMPCSGPS